MGRAEIELSRILFYAHLPQIGSYHRNDLFQVFHIAPFAARHVGNVTAPPSSTRFLGGLFEPDLDDERMGVEFR